MITGKRNVLIVEADAAVRDSCAAAVERLGCIAYSTAYIDDFETIIEQFSPSVLVLDLNMLARGGADLLNYLVQCSSSCSVLLLSGVNRRVSAAAKVLAASVGLDSVTVMKKPKNRLDLERRIQQRVSQLVEVHTSAEVPAFRRSNIFGGHFSAGH